MRKIGVIREKLAEMLSNQLGFRVLPEEMWLQSMDGLSRDCARWGAEVGNGINAKSISSWSTMTDCVKYGLDCGKDDDGWNCYSVESKSPICLKCKKQTKHGICYCNPTFGEIMNVKVLVLMKHPHKKKIIETLKVEIEKCNENNCECRQGLCNICVHMMAEQVMNELQKHGDLKRKR